MLVSVIVGALLLVAASELLQSHTKADMFVFWVGAFFVGLYLLAHWLTGC